MQTFAEKLHNKIQLKDCYGLLDNKELIYLSNVLCLSKHKFMEACFMDELDAAHTIDFPNFHEWKLLTNRIMENDVYQANYSKLGEEIMVGCLEEHINWIYKSHIGWPKDVRIDGKLDLLAPIVLKQADRTSIDKYVRFYSLQSKG